MTCMGRGHLIHLAVNRRARARAALSARPVPPVGILVAASPPGHRVPAPCRGAIVLVFLPRRVHLVAPSRYQRLLKKSRSAKRYSVTLEALEARTVLSFLPVVTFPTG